MNLARQFKTEKEYNRGLRHSKMTLIKYLFTVSIRVFVIYLIMWNLLFVVMVDKFLFGLSLISSLIFTVLFIPLFVFMHKSIKNRVRDYEAMKHFDENSVEYKWPGRKIKGTSENDHFSVTDEGSFEGKGVHATTDTDVFVGEYDLADDSTLTNKHKKKRTSPLNEIKFHDYFDENGNYLGDESPRILLDDMIDDIKTGFITKAEQIEELNKKMKSNSLPKSLYDFFIVGINKNT